MCVVVVGDPDPGNPSPRHDYVMVLRCYLTLTKPAYCDSGAWYADGVDVAGDQSARGVPVVRVSALRARSAAQPRAASGRRRTRPPRQAAHREYPTCVFYCTLNTAHRMQSCECQVDPPAPHAMHKQVRFSALDRAGIRVGGVSATTTAPITMESFSFTCTWSKNVHSYVLFWDIGQSQKWICI